MQGCARRVQEMPGVRYVQIRARSGKKGAVEMILEPCPFCGGEACTAIAITEDDTRTYSVICKDCNTGIFRPRFSNDEWDGYVTIGQAIDAWNRRKDK